MHLKIVGFKIHIDVEFIFQNGEMILLKGSSGAGKSTILQAIYWALYGNMRSIYNNSGITKNLSVTLALPGMTIFRKKNPELLTVTVNETLYEDAIAQAVIEKTYGDKDLWKSCSYIEQKSRCALLSGSSAERLELLNSLSFTGETPKDYISKISEKLKEVTKEFEIKQASFVTELEIYNKDMSQNPVKHILKVEEIETLKCDITSLEEEIKLQNEKVMGQERITGQYNYILETLEKSKTKLIQFQNMEFPVLQIEEIEEEVELIIPKELYISTSKPMAEKSIIGLLEYKKLKTTYTKQLNQIYDILNKKEKLELDIIELEKVLKAKQEGDKQEKIKVEGEKDVTKEQVWNAKKEEIAREKYLQEAKNIGIEYSEEILNSTLQKLSEQLTFYTHLEKNVGNYNKLLALEKELEGKNKADVGTYETLLNQKVELIADLKRGLELLSCPQCQTSLRYQNGQLSLGERAPVDITEMRKIEAEEKDIRRKISEIRQTEQLEVGADMLRKTIDVTALKEYISQDRNKIPTLTSFINKVSNIKYIPDPGVKALENRYNWQEYDIKKTELDSLEIGETEDVKLELQKLEDTYALEQNRVQQFQIEMEKYQSLENERLNQIRSYETKNKQMKDRNLEKKNKLDRQRKELEKAELEKGRVQNEIHNLGEKIIEIQAQISELEQSLDLSCKEKYDELCSELSSKREILEHGQRALKFTETKKELGEKRTKLLAIQKDVQILTKMKLKAVEIECKQLEDTVNNINTLIETTLPIFFNEPISMTLMLYKKVKNNLKPCLNLEICHKGCKYDNINSLSGGEGDRISLALLLALNFVSNSPIILLDECVSSLDGDLKESCIEAIKSIPNKTVICIDHDDTMEGYYDSIIEVK